MNMKNSIFHQNWEILNKVGFIFKEFTSCRNQYSLII